jgi:outer membrane lipoprotein-sorting protein
MPVCTVDRDTMIPERLLPLFAALAAAMLLISGTAGVAFAATPATSDSPEPIDVLGKDGPDGDTIVEEFRDRIDSLETVQFTRVTELTYDNETTTDSVRVHTDFEDSQKRVETLDGPTDTTKVWDDGHVIDYDAQENTVSGYEVTGTSLLPDVEGLANESLIDYEYRGIETVDGQQTYALDAVRDTQVQQNNDNATVSATLYVDASTYFPVRTEWHTSSEDSKHSSTVSYENVTLDEEIPESTFELDLPDDVEDNRNSLPDTSEYDSYDDLVSNTELELPDAELADGFSFDSGVVFDVDDLQRVTLTYTNGHESVIVTTRSEPVVGFDYGESDRYHPVEVGDTTGYVNTGDSVTSLYVEGDQSYTVFGEIDEETGVDIAEAIPAK